MGNHRHPASVVASTTRQSAQLAADLPLSHLFLAMTARSTVVTVSRHNEMLVAPTAKTHARIAAVRVDVAEIDATGAIGAIDNTNLGPTTGYEAPIRSAGALHSM